MKQSKLDGIAEVALYSHLIAQFPNAHKRPVFARYFKAKVAVLSRGKTWREFLN